MNKRKKLITVAILAGGMAIGAHAQAMAQKIQCLIIGDSIAVGASRFADGCYSAAQNGIKSRTWLKLWTQLPTAQKVLIALGTNDSTTKEAQVAMEEIRRRLEKTANEVVWIAPDERFPARAAVIDIAQRYGDTVYESPKEQLGRDKIHYTLTGYKRMAAAIKN